ncbi:LegC family aminotransferase [Candidatus Marinamargulisbacteria bacterium SCGC AG-410-N11]|nr:LegC family aminotransferase [Candidatus Marinamargulisbacteria bacterium SCGC AG-410-N11]
MQKCEFENIIKIIKDQYKTEEFIPLHEPRFNGNEKKYVLDCIDSTFVSSVGKYVDQFEKMVADYTGAKYAIATVNGTAAIHISLLLSGVSDNTEVITQPLTFVATSNAVSYCNAFPTFVDINKETLGLCPEKLEYFLKHSTKKTTKGLINIHTKRIISACLPMHTFGHPTKIDQIISLCDKFDIPVIEDAAESLGSTYKNQHTGTFGLFGTFSFNGNKTITSGGGGMIVTNDKELAKKAKHITTTAKTPHKWDYVHDEIGYNYRLPNLNAALGCAQMETLDGFIKSKRMLAQTYKNKLISNSFLFFDEPESCKSNYWLNTLTFKNKSNRDTFLNMSNNLNVMTRPCWCLMNTLSMYKKAYCDDLSNSTIASDTLVNIPSSVII